MNYRIYEHRIPCCIKDFDVDSQRIAHGHCDAEQRGGVGELDADDVIVINTSRQSRHAARREPHHCQTVESG